MKKYKLLSIVLFVALSMPMSAVAQTVSKHIPLPASYIAKVYAVESPFAKLAATHTATRHHKSKHHAAAHSVAKHHKSKHHAATHSVAKHHKAKRHAQRHRRSRHHTIKHHSKNPAPPFSQRYLDQQAQNTAMLVGEENDFVTRTYSFKATPAASKHAKSATTHVMKRHAPVVHRDTRHSKRHRVKKKQIANHHKIKRRHQHHKKHHKKGLTKLSNRENSLIAPSIALPAVRTPTKHLKHDVVLANLIQLAKPSKGLLTLAEAEPATPVINDALMGKKKVTLPADNKKKVTLPTDKNDALVLRPGDQLHIGFPGETAFNKNFTVDYRGYLMLPEIGSIRVAGLTLMQAKKALMNALSLSFHHTNFVRIQLRSRMLVINVLGHVGNPGRVTLPEDANVQMALNAAGGIRANAETDRVQLRRGDTVTPFDYRKYLDTGEIKLLPTLKTLDTIFVPSSAISTRQGEERVLHNPESSLKIIGAVSRVGSYKWDKSLTLLDYIIEAGGLGNNADTAKIKILRPNHRPRYYNLERFLSQGGSLDNMPKIEPGDIIKVPDLTRGVNGGPAAWHQLRAHESIYLFGAVGNAGRYRYKPGFDLIDLLAASGGVATGADIRHIRIIDHNSYRPNIQVADLAVYFKTGDRSLLPMLKPGDIVFIPPNVRNGYWLDYSPQSTVRILGSVGRPGHYRFQQNMTILDLLTEAGGPSGSAYLRRIVIIHMSHYQTRASSFNLLRFMKTGDIRLLPVIRPGDTIYVPDQSRTLWNKISRALRDIASLALITRPFE